MQLRLPRLPRLSFAVPPRIAPLSARSARASVRAQTRSPQIFPPDFSTFSVCPACPWRALARRARAPPSLRPPPRPLVSVPLPSLPLLSSLSRRRAGQTRRPDADQARRPSSSFPSLSRASLPGACAAACAPRLRPCFRSRLCRLCRLFFSPSLSAPLPRSPPAPRHLPASGPSLSAFRFLALLSTRPDAIPTHAISGETTGEGQRVADVSRPWERNANRKRLWNGVAVPRPRARALSKAALARHPLAPVARPPRSFVCDSRSTRQSPVMGRPLRFDVCATALGSHAALQVLSSPIPVDVPPPAVALRFSHLSSSPFSRPCPRVTLNLVSIQHLPRPDSSLSHLSPHVVLSCFAFFFSCCRASAL